MAIFPFLAGICFVLHGFGVEPDDHPSVVLWIGVALMCWHVAAGWVMPVAGKVLVRENAPT